jgi:hypothetical protein
MAIIIGIILSILLLVIKQSGRVLKFKILSFSICAILCLIILITTNLGWWYTIILPLITFVGIFLSLFILPFTVEESIENSVVQITDIYSMLADNDQIGKIQNIGFKQVYERQLGKLLYAFTSSVDDSNKILKNLYSEIYYPSSKITKEKISNHIHNSLDSVINGNKYLEQSLLKSANIYKQVFNIFVCILQINEEATDNLNRINKEREEFECKHGKI